MPRDAKLGLVMGLATVLAVAVMFFQREVESGANADKKANTEQAARSAEITPTSLSQTGAPLP